MELLFKSKFWHSPSMTVTPVPFSVHFSTPGFYWWPATGLALQVRAAVTVTITLDSWSEHLAPDLQHHKQWMVAGPLLDISVEPGDAIAEIYLPHFISLPGSEGREWGVG